MVEQGVLVVLGAISLVVLDAVDGLQSDFWNSVPGVAAALAGLACLAVVAFRRHQAVVSAGGVFSLLSLSLAFALLFYVVPGIILFLFQIEVRTARLRDVYDQPAAALWLLVLFWSAALFAAGFVSSRPHAVLQLDQRRFVTSRLVGVFGAGLAVSLLTIALRGRSISGRTELPPLLEPFAQVLNTFSAVMYLAVAGLVISPRSSDRRLAIVFGAVIAAVGFLEGFFKPVLWACLVLAIGWRFAPIERTWRRHSRRQVVVASVGLVFAVAFAVPIIQADRVGGDRETLVAEIVGGYQDSWGEGLGEGWSILVDKSMNRQAAVFTGPGLARDRVPDVVGYRGLDELLLAPSSLIPRAVWPGKPTLSTGVDVSILFYDAPSSTRSSSSLLLVGDAYWLAGLLGVALVGLVLGVVVGFTDARLRGGAAAAVHLALLPVIVDIEDSFSQWLNGAVQAILILSALALFSSVPSKRGLPSNQSPSRRIPLSSQGLA